MIRYTVPTGLLGTLTRTSRKHRLGGTRYHFVAIHHGGRNGLGYFATWHIAAIACCRASRDGSQIVATVYILPEHMEG